MGVDFRDLNNDGYPDLFFTALPEDTFPLFRNNGKGSFAEITSASGLARITRQMAGWSTCVCDFDNDGWKDIFVARSHALSPLGGRGERAKQVNSVFHNRSGSAFNDLTLAAGLGARSPQMYRGAAFGDLNGDGRLDVVVTALNAPAELWINAGAAENHWLALRLVGTVSNRDAVGARVTMETSRGKQYNHVTTAVGYASSSAGPVHFGLGADTVAKQIDIQWPSGKTQRLENVVADQVLRIVEEP
jgi:hypothetical protein